MGNWSLDRAIANRTEGGIYGWRRSVGEELHGIGTRNELRQTFDGIAQLYDEVRPSYPAALFDDVVAVSGATAEAQILEIGCGTGHATEEFAARGLAVDCVELGENMAALARRRLARFPRVRIEVADFDQWTTDLRYDLVFSATAYHWLNPQTREERIAGALRRGGWLAFWRNRHIRRESAEEFLDEVEAIYAAEAPELVKGRAHLPGPDEVLAAEREALSSQWFEEPRQEVYYWNVRSTASEYVRMLATHSDHQLLEAERRDRLLGRIKALIATSYGGSVVKDYATVLQVARRRS